MVMYCFSDGNGGRGMGARRKRERYIKTRVQKAVLAIIKMSKCGGVACAVSMALQSSCRGSSRREDIGCISNRVAE